MQVRRLAATDDLAELDARVSVCSACPRLVEWREDVARVKRASFAGQPYWGRPIAGWGAPTTGVGDEARLLIVGLAPAANGGNRTGRVFTGDSSGDWLFASLHRVGLATQERSEHAGDGQRLVGARMVATVRCAPPDNKPTVTERDTCRPWIDREISLLSPTLRVVVALGPRCRVRRAETATQVRARRARGPAARRGPCRGGCRPRRLLPPVAAQHLHRPAHPGDARRGVRVRPRPGRDPPGLTAARMRT
jgi:uracil-DNA glycosylase family 4